MEDAVTEKKSKMILDWGEGSLAFEYTPGEDAWFTCDNDRAVISLSQKEKGVWQAQCDQEKGRGGSPHEALDSLRNELSATSNRLESKLEDVQLALKREV